VSEPVEVPTPDEPAIVDAPAPKRSRSKKTGAKKKSTRPGRHAAKRVSRAASDLRLKVGGHTIVLPGSLAANLTPKDEKKLRAIFKRIVRREKKRGLKKKAAKKR
jgi:hypothetical protein